MTSSDELDVALRRRTPPALDVVVLTREQAVQVRRALDRLQEGNDGWCPLCAHADPREGGHAADCEAGQALALLEGGTVITPEQRQETR